MSRLHSAGGVRKDTLAASRGTLGSFEEGLQHVQSLVGALGPFETRS